MIDGARQIGKYYIIESVGADLFKENFIKVNLGKNHKLVDMFKNVSNVEDFYFTLSTIAGEKMGDKKHINLYWRDSSWS